jgi:hypothetical protein
MTHHWLEDVEEAENPTYTHGCKHCCAVGWECDWCDGSGLDEEDTNDETPCAVCEGEGVRWVGELARCDRCDARLDVPPREEPLLCGECRALQEDEDAQDPASDRREGLGDHWT